MTEEYIDDYLCSTIYTKFDVGKILYFQESRKRIGLIRAVNRDNIWIYLYDYLKLDNVEADICQEICIHEKYYGYFTT